MLAPLTTHRPSRCKTQTTNNHFLLAAPWLHNKKTVSHAPPTINNAQQDKRQATKPPTPKHQTTMHPQHRCKTQRLFLKEAPLGSWPAPNQQDGFRGCETRTLATSGFRLDADSSPQNRTPRAVRTQKHTARPGAKRRTGALCTSETGARKQRDGGGGILA